MRPLILFMPALWILSGCGENLSLTQPPIGPSSPFEDDNAEGTSDPDPELKTEPTRETTRETGTDTKDPAEDLPCTHWVSSPGLGSTKGTQNAWYSMDFFIEEGQDKVFCAPVEPPNINGASHFVEIQIRNRRSQGCGKARMRVYPPTQLQVDYNLEELGTPYRAGWGDLFNSQAAVIFRAPNRSTNPWYGKDLAAQGTYKILITGGSKDPHDGGCDLDMGWEISWRAPW